MLTAANSPLVVGTAPGNATMANVQVKVLRAFLLKAVRQEVGAVIEIDRRLALELAAANKLEILPPAPKAEAPSAPAEPEPEPAAARGRKKD